jgi:hypothetical protein
MSTDLNKIEAVVAFMIPSDIEAECFRKNVIDMLNSELMGEVRIWATRSESDKSKLVLHSLTKSGARISTNAEKTIFINSDKKNYLEYARRAKLGRFSKEPLADGDVKHLFSAREDGFTFIAIKVAYYVGLLILELSRVEHPFLEYVSVNSCVMFDPITKSIKMDGKDPGSALMAERAKTLVAVCKKCMRLASA